MQRRSDPGSIVQRTREFVLGRTAGVGRTAGFNGHTAGFGRATRSGEHRIRAVPSRGAVLAMATVAVLVTLVVGAWVLAANPKRLAAASDSPRIRGAASSPQAGGSLASPLSSPVAGPSVSRAAIVVDVVGKVTRPGVYQLPPGARVTDALAAAGGAKPGTDLTAVNLARKVVDGEQIAIAVPAAAGSVTDDAPAAAGGPGGSSTGPLDLNSATEAQLDALPGVGPVLAEHIISWRTAHGRFDSVNQLNSVSGIGDAKYADLAPLVSAG